MINRDMSKVLQAAWGAKAEKRKRKQEFVERMRLKREVIREANLTRQAFTVMLLNISANTYIHLQEDGRELARTEFLSIF